MNWKRTEAIKMVANLAVVAGTDRARASESQPALHRPGEPYEWTRHGIIGGSRALRRVLEQVAVVAPTPSTVLILGETGTGKELIARALHARSLRRGGPFVTTSAAAIPAGLLEAELFGHEKGAYTSAAGRRIGRFELADHGTLFLDEIGELPLELQPKLLRVLQEGEFERLGSSHTLRVDARIVAATNGNLGELVENKRFRADLFYRLNVFPIRMPPLRERIDDIPLLAAHFAVGFAQRLNRSITSISPSASDALIRYDWPGNIREMQNLIERAVILSTGSVLELTGPIRDETARWADGGAAAPRTLAEAERAHILRALQDTHGILSGPHGAAQQLGLHRSTLQFRMKKLGISGARPTGAADGPPIARAASPRPSPAGRR